MEPTLTAAEVAIALGPTAPWVFEANSISRVYQTDGWRGSMLVANAIGFICEAADHHADVLISWPRVMVTLSTHSAGGVTAKDAEVAGLIERHLMWRPGPASTLGGPTTPFVTG